ncbi:MAG: ABC transporter permease, partial [Clostridiales bacterium]|nr:ABC transporter permease [Clostridiales bacterium]
IFKVLPLQEVAGNIFAAFILVGVVVGVIASGISTGKHLKV